MPQYMPTICCMGCRRQYLRIVKSVFKDISKHISGTIARISFLDNGFVSDLEAFVSNMGEFWVNVACLDSRL